MLVVEMINVSKQAVCFLAGGLALLMLSSCAAGPNELVDTGSDPAGFWLGLWQGLIARSRS